MKSVGMQYLESIRALKAAGCQCLRTIHLLFVPGVWGNNSCVCVCVILRQICNWDICRLIATDEEIGGTDGMKLFVQSPLFESLNIGGC
jgi:hypothetical protein